MSRTMARIGQSRAVHLIDAENLCGSALLSVKRVRELRTAYMAAVPIGPLDQIILASAHISVVALGVGWPRQRYEMNSGPDGADIRLARIVVEENLHGRFDHVYMGSGDGGLAPFAGYLASAGVPVTVVSRIQSLSPRMRLAASNVIYLDRPGIAVYQAA